MTHTRRRHPLPIAELICCAALAAGTVAAQATWTKPVLDNADWHAMAFDTLRSRLVVFGGETARLSGQPPITWEWDGATWIAVQPAVSPVTRNEFAMAFDPLRGVTVLFGGTGASASRLGDTWEWDGTTWTERTPALAPAARMSHAMAFDSVRGRVVLFGGRGTSVAFNDTWEWDGASWVQRSPATNPPARSTFAMCFDAFRGRMVMFGGSVATAPYISAETWEWDGNDWFLRAPATRPVERIAHTMAWDSVRRRTVLFAGYSPQNGGVLGDTWEWDGATWTRRTSATSPPSRYGSAMVFDPVRSLALVFAGHRFENATASTDYLSDLWGWNGTNWTAVAPPTSPPNRMQHAMAYDSARALTVLFGGQGAGRVRDDTWTWDGRTWMQRTPATRPPARHSAAMAFDEVRGETVLFGGRNSSGTDLSDTWVWDGITWTQRNPSAVPLARSAHTATWNAARGSVIVFGGRNGAGELADTWSWDGATWAPVATAHSPPARHYHAIAHDAGRGVSIVFGGIAGSIELRDTWAFDGADWVQLAPRYPPFPRFGHALAYDPIGAQIVYASGRTTGTYDGNTFEWNGSQWLLRLPEVSPVNRAYTAMVYDAARARMVLFGGGDNSITLPRFSDTWEYVSGAEGTATSLGNGCPGSNGVPALAFLYGSRPWLGNSLLAQVENVPLPITGGVLAFGVSNTLWGQTPLPYDLGAVGQTGCTLFTSIDATLTLSGSGPSLAALFSIPRNNALVGARFYIQAFVFDPGVGALGLTVSNAVASIIGRQ